MTDVTEQYNQKDFNGMGIKIGALLDFATFIKYNDIPNEEINDSLLFSIALIIKELAAPVNDFLSWADTYAEIPGVEANKE
jgi:hypothetical protein